MDQKKTCGRTFVPALRIQGLRDAATSEMISKCEDLERRGIDYVALTVGEPDFDTPEYIRNACKKALDEGRTRYIEDQGVLEFRQAICEKMERDNGLHYTPDEVMVTTGVAMGMFIALLSTLDPGDEVMIPDPVYITYPQIPLIAGAKIVTYDILEDNDYQVDVDEIRSKITDKTKVIVIVSPSNPTGGVLSRKSVEAVAEIAKEHDLLVISDEIYDHFVYDDDTELVSIASLPGMKERTLVLNGLSKSMAMTGWRVGWIAAPKKMIDPMRRFAFYVTAGGTSFVQYAGITALREEDGSIERMRQAFKERRDFLVDGINRLEHFSCKKPEGAFYIFVNIKKTGMTSKELVDLAADKYRLFTLPGTAFGSTGEGYIRLSYAKSMDVLKRAVEILDEIDKDLTAAGV